MYQACLLHTRTDRALRAVVSSHLKKFGVTRMEWLLLASIKEALTEGAGMTTLAVALDVSLPQITALSVNLQRNGLIRQQADPNDRRAKIILVTQKGSKLITNIEVSMRSALKDWLAGIPMPQLEAYMNTVQQLATR